MQLSRGAWESEPKSHQVRGLSNAMEAEVLLVEESNEWEKGVVQGCLLKLDHVIVDT
jgi:hypothetical protein